VRAYAAEQIERQKQDFQRLGVLGDWDNPYLTMAYANEAGEIRVLGRLLQKGYVYRGLKPVNWCLTAARRSPRRSRIHGSQGHRDRRWFCFRRA